MSEYQYYEFQAIDHVLDDQALAYLRSLSTRADITPTSFVNVYNWGDFRGDPYKLMEKYFDAFLYLSNWGSRQLMFRLPRSLFEAEAARAYAVDYHVSIDVRGDYVVLGFEVHSEDGSEDWEEGAGWLSSLITLRSDLLSGDYRCLYLGWLLGVQYEILDEDTLEPPLPPGLRKLSPPLKRFADFFWIDYDLIETAADLDIADAPAGPSEQQRGAWIQSLPEAEKNTWLLRLLDEDTPLLHRELLMRFRQALKEGKTPQPTAVLTEPKRRTVGELLEAWQNRAEENRRREAERQARERERKAQEKAKERAKYLDELVGRESKVWEQVETLIQTKQAKNYDQATALLVDLRELGQRQGRTEEVRKRIHELCQRHASKHSLMKRFDKVGLRR
jgi:hypothetical protein